MDCGGPVSSLLVDRAIVFVVAKADDTVLTMISAILIDSIAVVRQSKCLLTEAIVFSNVASCLLCLVAVKVCLFLCDAIH